MTLFPRRSATQRQVRKCVPGHLKETGRPRFGSVYLSICGILRKHPNRRWVGISSFFIWDVFPHSGRGLQKTDGLPAKLSLFGWRTRFERWAEAKNFETRGCLYNNRRRHKCSISFHYTMCGGEHVSWGRPLRSPRSPQRLDTHALYHPTTLHVSISYKYITMARLVTFLIIYLEFLLETYSTHTVCKTLLSVSHTKVVWFFQLVIRAPALLHMWNASVMTFHTIRHENGLEVRGLIDALHVGCKAYSWTYRSILIGNNLINLWWLCCCLVWSHIVLSYIDILHISIHLQGWAHVLKPARWCWPGVNSEG